MPYMGSMPPGDNAPSMYSIANYIKELAGKAGGKIKEAYYANSPELTPEGEASNAKMRGLVSGLIEKVKNVPTAVWNKSDKQIMGELKFGLDSAGMMSPLTQPTGKIVEQMVKIGGSDKYPVYGFIKKFIPSGETSSIPVTSSGSLYGSAMKGRE